VRDYTSSRAPRAGPRAWLHATRSGRRKGYR
jgi:hypothetical protein